MPRKAEYLGDINVTPRMVRWTDDEWEELARRVHKKRMRHPEKRLWDLINEVQQMQADASRGIEAWPEDRKRKINGIAQSKPILVRLRRLGIETIETLEKTIPQMQDKINTLLQRPDKETMIAQFTPEEIARRFSRVCLQNYPVQELVSNRAPADILALIPLPEIFAYVGQQLFQGMAALDKRLTAHVAEHQAPKVNGHNGHAKVKQVPRIVLIGFQQHYLPQLNSHIAGRAELIYMPKSAVDMPVNFDHIILWEEHVPGQVRTKISKQFASRLTVHKGTFDDLISRMPTLACLKTK